MTTVYVCFSRLLIAIGVAAAAAAVAALRFCCIVLVALCVCASWVPGTQRFSTRSAILQVLSPSWFMRWEGVVELHVWALSRKKKAVRQRSISISV